MLGQLGWNAAIIENARAMQAHIVKNKDSKTYQACQRLPTRLRYGLTGTAMQNNHKELYYLLDLCAPPTLHMLRPVLFCLVSLSDRSICKSLLCQLLAKVKPQLICIHLSLYCSKDSFLQERCRRNVW